MPDKGPNTHLAFWERVLEEAPFLGYARWLTISALTRQRAGRLLEMIWDVHEQRQRRVETSELNRALEEITGRQPPRFHAGGTGKIYYGVQAGTAPPTFVLSVNQPRFFDRSYLRYLNNRLRERFGFAGSRIFLKLKEH